MTAPAIRSACRTDVPLILELIQALADYERLADHCVATEALLDASLFGAAPAAEVLIAELDGSAVGFALFFPSYSTFLARPGIWLEDLYVRESARGRGVGRALLAHLATIAIERGAGRLEWTVLDWNAPAIGFYRAIGAVGQEEWTTFRVTGDALARLAGGGEEAAT